MMKDVFYADYSKEALEALAKGAFLTTQADGKINTMTIGWGTIGHIWQKPVFMVMVRDSRHTYPMLEKSDSFTVSIPFGTMKKELALCGTKSGRDMDKFEAADLQALPGKVVNVPVVGGCDIHFECKIVNKQKMEKELLDPAFAQAWYGDDDYHTLYYGEIVACYVDDSLSK